VPDGSPRFAGEFDLDSQGGQQEIYVSHLGTDEQRLDVLNLSRSVDDSAWASRHGGTLVATDNTADAIVAITGGFNPGTAYAAVTPAGANNAPANPGPNYLGTIDPARRHGFPRRRRRCGVPAQRPALCRRPERSRLSALLAQALHLG
jgi:hypothetical protein